jgi:hypothetical protein
MEKIKNYIIALLSAVILLLLLLQVGGGKSTVERACDIYRFSSRGDAVSIFAKLAREDREYEDLANKVITLKNNEDEVTSLYSDVSNFAFERTKELKEENLRLVQDLDQFCA